MDAKPYIRSKILSNQFTRKDYYIFKNNMQIVKKLYHPDFTAGIDLPEAITQMAEDSTKVKNIIPIYLVLFLILLFGHDTAQAIIYILAVTVTMIVILWANASQRNLPVSTELRLIKLAFRMRKILKIRAREEKAAIRKEKADMKAQKNRQRGK